MARLNSDIMQLDDGATGAPRVAGPRSDTSQITDAEINAASAAAAKELGMTPYSELPLEVRTSMSTTEKQAYAKAYREEQKVLAAEERAASNPMFDFTNRPDAPEDPVGNFINYYSWIGGVTTGEWRLYRAPNSPENQAKYGSRAIGGETQASSASIVGANSLAVQPQPTKDENGNVVSWNVPESASTGDTDTTGTTGTTGTKGTTGTAGTTGTTGTTGTKGTGASTGTATTGLKTAEQIAAETKTATDKAARQSAYDLLYEEFDRYGLGSLVTPLKDLITSGASPSEFTIKLRETDAYKKRFSANEARIKNGLRVLSESDYIRNEDLYQEVMRRRGLPESYYAKGDMGVQKGFDALLAGDVSSTELEDRIVTAQDRVLNANPEIAATLKQFYPGISNGDILAYALDPVNAINGIKRKITAAEIGAAAGTYGLGATVGRAEQLAAAGITEATALTGFKTISQVGPRAGDLAQYYKQDPYTQETAEKEFFGLTGAREAEMQRKKLTELETRAFQGSAGAGAIARDRAGVI